MVKVFSELDRLTRIEVQFRGKGVPIQGFSNIRRYADIDLLKAVSFLNLLELRSTLKLQQCLAAERLQYLVQEVGPESPRAFRSLVPRYDDVDAATAMVDTLLRNDY